LEILLAGRPPEPLAKLLPGAFGPADLGVPGGMPAAALHSLEGLPPQEGAVAAAAWEAARAAWAPYTGALAGAALRMRSGRVFAGPYLENAAFNPSMSSMQTAIVAAVLGGESGAAVAEAALVRVEPSHVDHAAAARLLLDSFAPGVPLREIAVRLAGRN
jgi:cytidine deaminase